MKDDTSNTLPVDQAAATPSIDRVTHGQHQFGVLDLVLFTAGIAVGFAAISPMPGGTTFSVMSVLYSLISAVTVGSLFALTAQRIKARERFSQPGVLLLFATGIESLLYIVCMRIYVMYFQDEARMLMPGTASTVWYVLTYASITLIASGLLVWGMLRVTLGWKLVFLLCAVGRIMNVIPFAFLLFEGADYEWMEVVSNASKFVAVVALIACIASIVNDFQKNRVRSLMHWIGITSFLAFAALPFVQILLSRFLTTKQLYGI